MPVSYFLSYVNGTKAETSSSVHGVDPSAQALEDSLDFTQHLAGNEDHLQHDPIIDELANPFAA